MTTRFVWDPAEGLAIARCQLARFADPKHRVTGDHPSACQFCPWPANELEQLLRGFNTWANRDRHGVYGAHEVRVFREQPPADQRDQITAAQALTGSPWPPSAPAEAMDGPEAPAADAGAPPPPAWLGGSR